MRYLIKLSALMVLLLGAGQSFSEANWYGEVSGAFGGDTMAEVEVETFFGGDIEDASVKAGEGIKLAIGGRIDLNQSLDLILSAGYKIGGVFAADGDSISFNRFPLDAMLNINFERMSLGFGLTREIDGELDLKDIGAGKADIDDAFGQFVELNWKITNFFRIGGRYTFIEYELDGFSNTYDGNNLAVVASFTF